VSIYETDLQSLKNASKISIENINSTINSVKNEPKFLSNELTNFKNRYNDKSIERMEKFNSDIGNKIGKLIQNWNNCENELINIRKFFGEDPKKYTVDEFFSHLRYDSYPSTPSLYLSGNS
jgi:hypothetical protein